ncbi:MAG: hypothetical protein ACOX2L_05770 [Anaerolineae bacterium]
MAPIEVLFGALILVFALIGVVRGVHRELGVTTVLITVLLVLSVLGPFLEQGIGRLVPATAGPSEMIAENTVQTWFFIVAVMVAAFVAYASESIAFRGERSGGVLGLILGALIGAVNGYLIGGSVWYYLDRWHYAIGWLGMSPQGLSATARSILTYLPLRLLAQPVLLGQSWLLLLALGLVVAWVIRR